MTAALALSAALVLPATATAAPAPAPSAQLQLPASPLDELGRPTDETAQAIRDFVNQPWVPEDLRNAALSALAFARGDGGGEPGAKLPENGPNFRQFVWPTVSGRCIDGQSDAVGSAIAVPGPSEIPAPGAAEGETTFLFTGLGTAPAAKDQGDMRVQWLNLTTLQGGETSLENHGINPDGPGTVSGTAKTGKGLTIAWLHGTLHTEKETCGFMPTAAFIDNK